MRKNGGFTIIEMIVAILIIAILISVAIPNYMRQLETAKCVKATSTLKIIRAAQLSYFSEAATFLNNQAAINDSVGGQLFALNPDWTFSITTASDSLLQINATRLTGPHQGTAVTLTDDPANNINQRWGGSYPMDDPGNF